MNEIKSYVGKAFAGIPESKEKSEITQEIIERLEDNAQVLIKNGKEREDAINKAIVDFGDMNEIIDELRGQNGRIDSGRSDNGRSAFWFSIVGSIVILLLLIFINFYYSPQHIWFIYPAFAILWWPLCLFFFGKWRKK